MRLLNTLHARLLALVALVSVLTIAALGAVSIQADSRTALQGLRQQAEANARSLASASTDALVTQQLDQLDDILLRDADSPDVLRVHLLAADGAVLGHAARQADGHVALVFDPPGSRLAPPTADRPHTVQVGQPPPGTLVAWQPVQAGGLLGWARVEQSMAPLVQLRQQVWQRTLAAAAGAVLAGGVLLWLLLRGPMRALDQARRFAEELAAADGRQLPVAPGPTETVALGHALNQASRRLGDQRQALGDMLAALQQHKAELQDSNLALRAVFALSPDALVSFDAQGRVLLANPAFSRLTGLAADQVEGRTQRALEQHLRALLPPGAEWAGLAPCFQDERPSDGPGAHLAVPSARGLRLHLLRPRPTDLLLLGLQADAQDGAGAVRRLLYLRDVTHETEVERLKAEFLSTAAHELRTPLTSIHGFIELLLMREFPPERRQQMLDRIHRNSGILIHIVNELLDLSRIEAGGAAELQREPIDLARLVDQGVADHGPPEGREPPRLLAADGHWPVVADAAKIGQVLRNLLSNAYKYSPAGGPVAVRLLREQPPDGPGRVGFEVRDSGIGMTPEQVARVFERFYRADPSGQVLGAGLGMSIVHDIVRLHDGQVQVHSTPGQGTAVQVWLPASAAGGDPDPAACHQPDRARSPACA